MPISQNIHVFVQNSAILSFQVFMAIDRNDSMKLVCTPIIYEVNGDPLIDNDVPARKWSELTAERDILHMLKSKDVSDSQYKDAKFVAELKAKERLAYV